MALFQPPMELCTDSPGTKKYSVLKFRERKCQQGGTSPLSKIHVSEHSLHGVLFLQILVQFLNREIHRSYLSQYRIASKWREKDFSGAIEASLLVLPLCHWRKSNSAN